MQEPLGSPPKTQLHPFVAATWLGGQSWGWKQHGAAFRDLRTRTLRPPPAKGQVPDLIVFRARRACQQGLHTSLFYFVLRRTEARTATACAAGRDLTAEGH